jgi:hypothetical protein
MPYELQIFGGPVDHRSTHKSAAAVLEFLRTIYDDERNVVIVSRGGKRLNAKQLEELDRQERSVEIA